MNSFKIERGIPLPPPGNKNKFRVAFGQMKPLDSFFVDSDSTRRQALNFCQKNKIKIRTSKENGVGFRIWLIEKTK